MYKNYPVALLHSLFTAYDEFAKITKKEVSKDRGSL
jgi:hypothetical protein